MKTYIKPSLFIFQGTTGPLMTITVSGGGSDKVNDIRDGGEYSGGEMGARKRRTSDDMDADTDNGWAGGLW